MTFEQLDKNFEKVVRDLGGRYQADIMASVGIAALTKIKQRVQEKGENAKGQKFPGYSTRPMLANCSTMTLSACSKIAGSKSKRKELNWVTLKRGDRSIRLFSVPGGYKQFRELHGRQTNHVDFSFTNRMWDDINLISNVGDHQNGVAIIGARLESEKKKLEGNTRRKGEILNLSPKEIEELKKTYNLGVLKVFTDNGL